MKAKANIQQVATIHGDEAKEVTSPVSRFIALLATESKLRSECPAILKDALTEGGAWNAATKQWKKGAVSDVCAELLEAAMEAGYAEKTVRSYLCHARQSLGIMTRGKGAGRQANPNSKTANANENVSDALTLATLSKDAIRAMSNAIVDNMPVGTQEAQSFFESIAFISVGMKAGKLHFTDGKFVEVETKETKAVQASAKRAAKHDKPVASVPAVSTIPVLTVVPAIAQA